GADRRPRGLRTHPARLRLRRDRVGVHRAGRRARRGRSGRHARRHGNKRSLHPRPDAGVAGLHDRAMSPEQFLYYEARLLDTQRYEEWLELFTDDATYWVPLEQNQKDPFETSSIVHDDRTLLELRVRQACPPRAHARQPLART